MIWAGPGQGKPAIRLLYVVYWGLLEPLGQALVLPSVLKLAVRGARITLISYEKPPAKEGSGGLDQTRRLLAEVGVTWIPLRYHKRPRVPATLFDVLHGWVRGTLAVWRHGCDIVHARTFVAGLIGLGVTRVTHSALVYHNEGFYPDEQVDSGVWRSGSTAHRLGRWLEARLYQAADAIIALSHRAQRIIRNMPDVARLRTPVLVVPSSVDLGRFLDASRGARDPAEGVRFVYSGSLGGRYLLPDVARFMSVALEVLPGSSLTILSWASRDQVAAALVQAGVPSSTWALRCVPHQDMPRELLEFDAGLHFAASTSGGAGGSPTKVGEYWASGLPVVATSGIGDLDEIIQGEKVGVLLGGLSRASFQRAILELQTLLRDPGLARRCRAAAEAHHNLEVACSEQVGLYERLRSGDL